MQEIFNEKIGFIGCGNMANAIIGGLLEKKAIDKQKIYIYDIIEQKLKETGNEKGVNICNTITELVQIVDVVFLAVKPQNMEEVLKQIKQSITVSNRIFSIAAGITTGFIENILENTARVIRIMPNTGALVGQSASAVFGGKNASDSDVDLACRIFGIIGKVIKVKNEGLMDAVTALSGSGPAYFFYLVEALVYAGKKIGLDEESSNLLTKQTLFGASLLLNNKDETPEELRRKVTSKEGTTEAAIKFLEEKGFRNMVVEAVESAYNRAKKLAK